MSPRWPTGQRTPTTRLSRPSSGELRTVLAMAIDELPPACRAALLLRVMDGRSSRDIAHALGLSVPVVKTRVHQARLFLRERLGAYEAANVVTRTC